MRKELLKRIINALQNDEVPNTVTNAILIKDIDVELAKPDPEPVAWMDVTIFGQLFICNETLDSNTKFKVYKEQPDQSARIDELENGIKLMHEWILYELSQQYVRSLQYENTDAYNFAESVLTNNYSAKILNK